MSSKRFIAGVVLLVLLVVAFGERRTLLQARSRHEVLAGQITERSAGFQITQRRCWAQSL